VGWKPTATIVLPLCGAENPSCTEDGIDPLKSARNSCKKLKEMSTGGRVIGRYKNEKEQFGCAVIGTALK
jgi:hypothetical protein